MSETSKTPRTIRMRSWRTDREIGETEFSLDLIWAQRANYPVRTWTGEDREGNALEVTWVANRCTGHALAAYEISGGA